MGTLNSVDLTEFSESRNLTNIKLIKNDTMPYPTKHTSNAANYYDILQHINN